MAVTPQVPQFAKDFWPAFRRRIGRLALGLQVLATAGLAGVLYLFDGFGQHLSLAIAILVGYFVLGCLAWAFVIRRTTWPARALLAAIVHITGEPTTSRPPNPNNPLYARSGFKEILQTLYELASQKGSTTPAQPAEAAASTDTPSTSGPAATSAADTPALIQSALDETSCGFVVMDHQRRIVFTNKAAPTSVDQQGTTRLQLLFNGQDSLDAWLDECEQSSVHAEHTWTRIADKLPEDEDRRFFDVVASYDKGAKAEVVLTLIDRTALYSVGEQELDFIAFAAHELRGPITVIRGYLDVLEDELAPVLQDDQSELFRRLTVSANRLSGYINNILNTSRYDRRHLKLHLVELSLPDVYDTIADDMQLRAKAQNRLLSVTIPTDLPSIAADINSLSEVFGNLIDNAIKYSNEGGAIEVTASAKGDTVELSVTDHGIGMPGNVVSNLFQKFYRSHRSRETVAGTGIGLYISKAIVESHGGHISVRSEEGQGSTFTVSLPTFRMVADKLKAGHNGNEGLIEQNEGWIKNHSMYRG